MQSVQLAPWSDIRGQHLAVPRRATQFTIDWSRPVWSAVYAPGAEAKARAGLEDIGFGMFLPTYVTSRIRKGRRYISERPLLPGYVLITIQPDQMHCWSDINSVEGVARLLEVQGRPLQIADEDVRELTLAHANGAFNRIIAVQRSMADGEKTKRRKPRNSYKLKKIRGLLNEALAMSRKG